MELVDANLDQELEDDFACAYTNSESSCETVHPRSLGRAFTACSLTYSIELVEANLEQESDIKPQCLLRYSVKLD